MLFACKKEDDTEDVVPPRDRGAEAIVAEAEVRTFLQTHFYNYEEFQNPPADFDFKIEFGLIEGINSTKIPLIDQVSVKQVTDTEDEEVVYDLYYLVAVQGGGETIQFADVTTVKYEGLLLSDLTRFDNSIVPIRFDLSGFDNKVQSGLAVIEGIQTGLVGFNVAENFLINSDGTLDYKNFGVGAVFLPSGLAYYQNSPSIDIPQYAQLIFTFQTLQTIRGDQDNDGILTIFEDLNNNMDEKDDDTDKNRVPNYLDRDDDGDEIPTSVEIRDENGNIPEDNDGDGMPDYPKTNGKFNYLDPNN